MPESYLAFQSTDTAIGGVNVLRRNTYNINLLQPDGSEIGVAGGWGQTPSAESTQAATALPIPTTLTGDASKFDPAVLNESHVVSSGSTVTLFLIPTDKTKFYHVALLAFLQNNGQTLDVTLEGHISYTRTGFTGLDQSGQGLADAVMGFPPVKANGSGNIVVRITATGGDVNLHGMRLADTPIRDKTLTNYWLPSGTNGLVGETLGDISSKSLRVEVDDVYWPDANGYLFSQAAKSSTLRMAGLFRIGTALGVWVRGVQTNITDDVNLHFDGGIIDGSVVFEIDNNSGAYSFSIGGIEYFNGTAAVGTMSAANYHLRIGARSNSDDVNVTGSEYALSDISKVGNTRIFVDDVLTRNYQMSAAVESNTVTDSVAEKTLTLTAPNPTGNFEVNIVPPPEPNTARINSAMGFTASANPWLSTRPSMSDGTRHGSYTNSYENVVFIGASLVEGAFGNDLNAEQTTANSILHGLGAPNTAKVYGYGIGGKKVGNVLDQVDAALAKFPEKGKTLFVLHIGGNDVSALRPFSGVTQQDKDSLINDVNILKARFTGRENDLLLCNLTFRDYLDQTANDQSLGSKPFNDEIFLKKQNFIYENVDGRPVVDMYGFTFYNQHLISADNVHLTASGKTAMLEYMVSRVAFIFAGTPMPAPYRGGSYV